MQTEGRRVAMVSMASPARADDHLARVLRPLSIALAARGARVDVLSRAAGSPAVSSVGSGVAQHELAAGPASTVGVDGMAGLADAFGEAVAERARISSYDVIHAHGWTSGLAALPVSLELGTPLVQSFHGLGVRTPGATEQRIRTEMFLANQADAIVTGSVADVAVLIDEVRAPADRIWVIPPGVDLDVFRPERARSADDRVRAGFGIDHDRPVIAVVGPASSTDMALSIRALSELHSLRGWAPVLVLVGAGALPDIRPLLRLADELGVAAEVRMSPNLEQGPLADLLAVATVAVLPSASPPAGTVALEAAASGTPVVGFRGAGPRESVSEGTSALLVDSRDPREWARTITELLDDQVALDGLSASARLHAEGYTWAAAATALLGVYAGLG